MVGLFFQIVQLAAYGIATSNWYERATLEIESHFSFRQGDVVRRWSRGALLDSLSIDQCIRVYLRQRGSTRYDDRIECPVDR
jgi:hypothetical protein